MKFMTFGEWVKQLESSARTRNATGIYPPNADTVMAKPPYSQMSFCRKIKEPGVKLINLDPSQVCSKKKKK